jgi:hypothetical protein
MNCQVGSASHLRVRFPTFILCSLTGLCPKALITFQIVGSLLAFEGRGRVLAVSIGRCLREPGQRFPLDYCSHVRLLPFFRTRAIFPETYTHYQGFSIAIWNKNKYAMALAVITWVTNVSVIIQGKSFSCRLSRISYQHYFVLGVARVNN